MGSVSANFYPSTTGLTLGTSNQQWIAYLSNAFANTYQSSTVNPALSGTVRLASTDFVAWRNNANTADITLSKTGAASGTVPADALTLGSSGAIIGDFISNSANPSGTGSLRLADTDSINFRNHINNADLTILSKNSSDVTILGTTAGVITPGVLNIQSGGFIATGGSVLNGALSISGAITGNGTNGALTLDTPNSSGTIGALSITAGTSTAGAGGAGGNIAITAGTGGGTLSTGGSVTIAGGSAGFTGNGGSVVLNGGSGSVTSGTLQTNTTFSSYDNITTAGMGVPPIFGATSQKTETAADTNVLTYTPAAVVGSYRVRFVMSVASATTATLGWTVTYKDSSGNAQSPTNMGLLPVGSATWALTTGSISAAGNYYGYADIDIDNSATAIVVKLTATGTFSAKVSATIERLI